MIVFYLDKSLSLRLGRPANIQKCDIVQFPWSSANINWALMGYCYLWFEVSGIQGYTYEQRDISYALLQARSVRETRTYRLAAELQRVTDRTKETNGPLSKPAWLDAFSKLTLLQSNY